MMCVRSSIRARNEPVAGVETAPRSAGVGAALKWTSL